MTKSQSVIHGRVYDPKGEPVVEARVYFMEGPVSLPDLAVLTDGNGEFSLSAPTAGTYQIGCAAYGFVSTTVTVHITSGQDAQIEIRMREGYR